jgi:hypothetical protein
MCSLVRLASPGIGGDDLLIYLGNDSFCTSIPSPYLVLIEFKRATVLVRMLKYMSLTWNCELETDNIEGAQFRQRRTIQAKAHSPYRAKEYGPVCRTLFKEPGYFPTQ